MVVDNHQPAYVQKLSIVTQHAVKLVYVMDDLAKTHLRRAGSFFHALPQIMECWNEGNLYRRIDTTNICIIEMLIEQCDVYEIYNITLSSQGIRHTYMIVIV